MTLNASGPISLGGSTVGQSINLELGNSATAQADINSSPFRTLAGVASGQISLSSFYGKSNTPPFFVNVSATQNNLQTWPGTRIGVAGGAVYAASPGGSEGGVWVSKLNADGTVSWANKYNGFNAGLMGTSITDASGNTYIFVGDGSSGLFTVKLNSSGAISIQKRVTAGYPLASYNYARGVDFDSAGNLYVVFGNGGSIDLLVKFDTSLNVTWAYRITDASATTPIITRGVAVDSSDNIIVVGSLNSGAGVALKFNSSGTVTNSWAISLASGINAPIWGIDLDSSNNIYVVGNLSNYIYVTKFTADFASASWSRKSSIAFAGQPTGISVTSTGTLYVGLQGLLQSIVVGGGQQTQYGVLSCFTTSGTNSFNNFAGLNVANYPGIDALYCDGTSVYFHTFSGSNANYYGSPYPSIIARLPADGTGASALLNSNTAFYFGTSGYTWTTVTANASGGAGYIGNSISLTSTTSTAISSSAATRTNTVISYASTSGSSTFTSPGTYTWICPTGVTSASAALVGGGGGGGAGPTRNAGGGGGAAGYRNGVAVTPGASYTVVVGYGGGAGGNNAPGTSGGLSSVFSCTAGGGGGGGAAGGTTSGSAGTPTGSFTASGYGGLGGSGAIYDRGGGGAGAGGYSVAGGAGNTGGGYGGSGGTSVNGGGGGGGGGGNIVGSTTYYYGGGDGGGIGMLGTGGTGGTGGAAGTTTQGASGVGNSYSTGWLLFGAGGAGGGCSITPSGCCCVIQPFSGGYGQAGAVRIIWGSGRSFPSTNTQTP